MRTLTILGFLILFFSCNSAKKETVIKTNYTVTTSTLKETVNFLASNDLKGRDTGSEGINEAANYIEKQYKTLGLKPYFKTYRDNFKFGKLDAFNIVGYLEGTDPELKNEFILIGAHYDHIGIIKTVAGDSIANGANDNAAGTSGVLALARFFSENKSNKRSLIFAAFTAEEKGLLGSKHLAEKLKEKKLNLYTMINLEMIGVPFKNRDYQAFITGYNRSNLAEVINGYAGEKLIGASDVAKKYDLFKRSDNYPFYQAFKVPSHTVSSCDLSNYDFYHHVDDEANKLDYTFMAKLLNKLAPVIEKIANAPTQNIKINE